MTLPVLATHHPAYLFRDSSEILPTIMDWAKVPRMLAGTWPAPVPPPLVGTQATIRDVFAWFDYADTLPWIALDTEYFPETSTLTMLGMGGPDKRCLILPWLVDQHYTFNDYTRHAIAKRLRRLVARVRVVMHNALADLPILDKNLQVVVPPEQVEDTMLADGVLWSELAHDLGSLARRYCAHNQHKQLANVDPIAYNHGDVLATIDAWVALQKELAADPASERVYREQSLALIPLLLEAHERGIRLDQQAVQAMATQLGADKTRIGYEAQATVGWPINLGSVSSAGGRSHLQVWLGQAMGYPAKLHPKTHRPTWDDDALAGLAKRYPEDPIIGARLAYAGVTQLLSHYITPFLKADGSVVERCYPRFSLHTQTSGRWSTQDPPMATLPRTGRLDTLFVPDPGEVWLGYDIDQAELRVMACESGDATMLAVFREGRDIHTENTMALWSWWMLPDDWQGKRDERRTFAKVATHKLDYLGDPGGAKDIPGAEKLGVTKDVGKHMAQEYFARYPGLRRYHVARTSEYQRTRTARTFAGRRRIAWGRGMAMVRELINHPLQGGVADIFNLTLLRVWHALRPLGGRFVFQSHDAAWWGVPAEHEETAQRVIQEIFLDPWRINGVDMRMPVSFKPVRRAP